MFNYFEKKLYPYPDIEDRVPSKGISFRMGSHKRRATLPGRDDLVTAAIGAFEALFFAILGKIVDWLSRIPPALLWEQEQTTLLLFAGLLAVSPILVGLQNLFKHQVLGGNFPMRLRWNFHRLMLNQSMNFYQVNSPAVSLPRSCKLRWRCGMLLHPRRHPGVCDDLLFHPGSGGR